MSEENMMSVFSTPMSVYKNHDLLPDLKKHILSLEQKGVESDVAPQFKHNLHESKFDFFKTDIPVMKDTVKWFTQCIAETVNFIHGRNAGYRINFNDSWYHITKTNGVHENHVHSNCSWCGIYYVQSGDPDRGGDTVFQNPVDPTYIDQGNTYLMQTSRFSLKPEDGALVLFPSYLAHAQSLYTGNTDRIVVAFNSAVIPLEEQSQ